MSVLLEFSMFPTDKGESKSAYVSRVIDAIDRCGHPYQLTPMSTIVETETLDEALEVIRLAHAQLSGDCKRIYSALKLDIRDGGSNRLKSKIESVEKQLGRDVKH